jgi:hypothetical protein
MEAHAYPCPALSPKFQLAHLIRRDPMMYLPEIVRFLPLLSRSSSRLVDKGPSPFLGPCGGGCDRPLSVSLILDLRLLGTREGSGAVGALGGGPLGGSRPSRCRSRPELISPLLLRSPVLLPPPAIARGAEGAAGTRPFGASGIFFSEAGFI